MDKKRQDAVVRLSDAITPTIMEWREAWKETRIRSVSIGVRFEDGTERWTIFGRRIPFPKESET